MLGTLCWLEVISTRTVILWDTYGGLRAVHGAIRSSG
jgi:hypothetical protein